MPKTDMLPDAELSIELSDAADVKRLAGALALLRQYALEQGDDEVLNLVSDCEEALQNLDKDTQLI